MNSTLDEGENFLRDQEHSSGLDHLSDQNGVVDQPLQDDIPDIIPTDHAQEDPDYLESNHDLDDSLQDKSVDDSTPSDIQPSGVDDSILPSIQHHDQSNNGSFSTPDDTPSLQGSLLSSPRSETASLRSPGRRGSPSSVHRPFDIRFQSRLSSSQFSPLRSASPAFLGSHSRHGSITSFAPPASDFDETVHPWDVIHWSKFRKLSSQVFSELGKRNFGSPSCLAVADQLVIGTSKGLVLVFDHQQNHKAIIGSGTKAAESGPVTAIAISADQTTVAVGHATGHIFTWEFARSTRPFLHIQPIDASQAQARRGDGHIQGSGIPHIGFLGYRHTALVSADDKGMAFSHLATRGMGSVGRVVRTTRILGRYPELVSRATKPLKKSSVLAFSPLPLGNIEQRTDGLGLVAMLTPYLLVIVSTTPIAQTQHKAARPKEVAAHSAMTAALAWFPAIKLKSNAEVSRTKLVYAWSNILTVLEVHEAEPDQDADKNKPPELQFLARSRFQSDEAIVAVQWLNKSVLAVLTITQQLLILEDFSMHVTEAFDLLNKSVHHTDLYSQQLTTIIEHLDEEDTSLHGVVADAFHMSFRAYKGRLFLLGSNDIWTGALTNWADRLLALMNVGDFIGAIRLATKYHMGQGEKATIGLPEEDSVRAEVVNEKLSEMITASLRYAFGKNQQAGNEQIEKPQLVELADACIKACLVMDDQDFMFEEAFTWYDDHDMGAVFVDVLEPYILDRTVTSLPPPALKTLIDHFVVTHSPSALEEIICMLDTSSMDLDQVTNLCKRHGLYDAYIYVWTSSLRDYTTPITLLLDLAEEPKKLEQNKLDLGERYALAQKIFPYISFILTSRVYPTGDDMGAEIAIEAKTQIYDYFFSGVRPVNGSFHDPNSGRNSSVAKSFSALARILHFGASNFIAAMNEAFEDNFLNSGDEDDQISTPRTYTRQFIVRILLDIMSTGYDRDETIYLDMFIARNLAKYPQHMMLSGSILHEIFTRLCGYPDDDMQEDAQLSVEYLLSIYQPPNILGLVPLLEEARFFRVLKAVYRQEHQFPNLIHTYFVDRENQDEVFTVIADCLRPRSLLLEQQRKEVRQMVEEHAADLIDIDVHRTASTIDEVASDLHRTFLLVLATDEYSQYEYLKTLFEPESRNRRNKVYANVLKETYVRLLCQFDPSHVRNYIEHVKEGDLRLEKVLPTIEENGIVDAAVILQVRQGQVKEAMHRLAQHLALLGSTLRSLNNKSTDGDDGDSIRHSSEGVLESIEKYSQVGIWLCQEQMKQAPRPAGVAKSPRRSVSATRALAFEEQLWLDMIVAVVAIAREFSTSSNSGAVDEDDNITASLRRTIQQVFTALLASTTSVRDASGARDVMFLRILRAFLTHAAESSPSLAELRSVIKSIFAAYAHEGALLSLSNSMLDKDVFVRLDEVTALRQRGWRPRGQICEVCRRRVWGPSMSNRVWEDWQKQEEARSRRRKGPQSMETDADEDGGRGKGKATVDVSGHEPSEESGPPETSLGPIVVFSCRHMYHQRCLVPGQAEDGTPQLMCPACV
ncbi:hypothetical protein PV10_03247 [Exophiala mesophila]|uniref:Uncharacterized protein n=1 Tax=Exophiala mesophila TaxID=212818 RepID=A0A0D1ZLX9_EXOME|nr:uncharacterized protein PV10_03247 [Exophiala mesophila]KIV95617.1 hypothetical protein PV10_03247 [Exophiala mesophila]